MSLFSDYGVESESVGVVKSVLRTEAPAARVIDITHSIPAYDVKAGSLALVRTGPSLAPGVVVAIVDAATARPIAVEVGDGESVLLGPDNGLLAPLAAMVGGGSKAVLLSIPEQAGRSRGRDVYAPAAGRLCRGADLEALGEPIDPSTLRPSLLPFSAEKEGNLEADVLWIDSFGNTQLNVTPDQLENYGEHVELAVGGRTFVAQVVTDLDGLGPGRTGLIVDGSGLMSLLLDKASAAQHHGLSEQDSVTIRRRRP